MIVLSCSNLSKSFVVDNIFSNVSFNLEDGDRVGLIGVNGSGKTTLFNVLVGNLEADEGTIYRNKDRTIGYLTQHSTFDYQATLEDYLLEVFEPVIQMERDIRDLETEMASHREESTVLEGLMNQYATLLERFQEANGYGYHSAIRGVLKGMGFSEEQFTQSAEKLSGGQKSRLMLARLLLQQPDILLLDEPTNHLDMSAIAYLESYLQSYRGAVFLISHDRYFLDNVVNRIFLLENGTLQTYNTNYSKYVVQRKIDLDIRMHAFDNQQKEIKRQEEIIERFANYGGSRYIKQSQSRKKLLDKMKRVEKPFDGSKKMILRFNPLRESGKDVILSEDLGMSFGEHHLFSRGDFQVYKGEKVGLIGDNGVGKTTLFNMIRGTLNPTEGELKVGQNVQIGYYDQEQRGLDVTSTIIDELWDEHPTMTHYDIRSLLAKFLFFGDDLFKTIDELSGGERGRIALLKLMLGETNLLLMDEPTNHLDIDSKEVLEEALLGYTGTCFIISHDRYFLNKVVDKLLVLTESGVETYLGNYDYYLQKIDEIEEEEEQSATVTRTQLIKETRSKNKTMKELREKRRRARELEAQIESLERSLEELQQQSYDTALYDDHEKAAALFVEIDEVKDKKDHLSEEWLIISMELEEEKEG